jgi:sulfate transport system substrate-binding protein
MTLRSFVINFLLGRLPGTFPTIRVVHAFDAFRGPALALALVSAALTGLTGCGSGKPTATGDQPNKTVELLNVSYDPTRELYRDINAAFAKHYEAEHGTAVTVEAIAKSGLLRADWQHRYDNDSVPYHSIVVFVVRKGNPKKIADWADLDRGDVSIITPNPKTSGNGKYSFLAAWGAALAAGGSEDDAKNFVSAIYRRTPVLDTGARAATATFSQKGIGDVHLTFEQEAHLEVDESKGDLEIVYPKRSIRVDPPVAVVDTNVDRKASRHAAEAYLGFLYSPEGRAIIAKHHLRPWGDNPPPPAAGETWPAIETFDIAFVAGDWNNAMKKFFGEGGVFDAIYQPQARK